MTVPAPAPEPGGLSRFVTPAWIAGATFCLFVLSVGLTRLTWLASRARPVETGTWTRLADEIGESFARCCSNPLCSAPDMTSNPPEWAVEMNVRRVKEAK